MKYSALIGNPVEHSISPLLFQTLMDWCGIEYAHLKIKIENKSDLKKSLDELFDLDFVGANITCPYKKDVYNFIDEFEENAKQIYSINTVYKKNNKLIGCNTDGVAAVLSIKKHYTIADSTKIVIFGAGGAAYSIFYELSQITKNICVVDQNIDDALLMVDRINKKAKCFALKEKSKYIKFLEEADIIINATSVGMYPNDKSSILTEGEISKLPNNKTYFDVVFNPWITKFLAYAKKYNNFVISGGDMLINQALLALEKWTNMKIELTDQDYTKLCNKLKKELKKIND